MKQRMSIDAQTRKLLEFQENEYKKHLINIRRAHNMIYKNLETLMFFKANILINKKLTAMKNLVEREVASVYDRLDEITSVLNVKSKTTDANSKIIDNSQKQIGKDQNQTDLNLARETQRKITQMIGQKYLQN